MKSRAFDKSKYTDWIDPNIVKPYEHNAKLHPPKQIEAIVKSINRFGWQQDTVITADNVLVVGHGRRLAALQIGCEMPYHRVGKNADELTDDDIKALRLADNKTNESPWDYAELEAELAELELSDLDMGDFGFDDVETEEQEDFEAPESFKEYDEEMRTGHKCPRCGYEWN